MLEFFHSVDVQLFYLINVTLSNIVFDYMMPFITYKKSWYPVWAIIIVLLLWKGGKNGRLMVLFVIPLILFSDQSSAGFLKPLIDRVRPCNALENINLLVRRSKAPSMPSAHAANFFAVATYFGYYFRKYRIYFFIIAAMVAYSRIYVGVHYPFDTVVGALVGVGSAYLTIFLRQRFDQLVFKKQLFIKDN